jgi:transcriptional regulator with XRE-family HTH domain
MPMPRRSKLKLPPLNLGKETIGQRLARLRKERGYTQIELAEKTRIPQTLITDYERDKIRLHPEMVIRFAQALEVTADELLGINASKDNNGNKPSLRLLRRVKRIEDLPPSQQKTLLKTIDTFLKGAGKG